MAACALAAFQPARSAPVTVQLLAQDGKPLPGAVVGVLLNGAATRAAPGGSAQIGQRDRQFQPGIAAIQTGTAVQFPNFDTVRHHVYSFSPIKRFEIKLYAGTPATPVVFDKPGVAVLGCNIHDRMSARVIVMDTALLARTNEQGVASFEVPAGSHRLQAWHAGMADNTAFAERSILVPGAGMQLSWTVKGEQP